MKRRSTVSAAIAVVASLVLAGSALAAFAGATNGSFEQGTYVDGGAGFQTLAPGATALSGWTISAGSVDWIGTYWTATDGSKSLDLNGTAAGTVSQVLATTIGKTYVVTFALSGNPEGLPVLKTMTVGATGTVSQAYTFDRAVHANTRANMMWQAKQYSFLATSASTTLTFASTTASSAYGPALDKVVVTEAGAAGTTGGPGAACKNGGWKTAIDRDGSHFKNQGDCVSYYATKGKNAGSVKH